VEELPMFPVQPEFMSEVRLRVNIARQIDVQQHRLMKKKKQADWFIQAAEEADIILDDDFAPGNDDDDDDGSSQDKATERRNLTELQYQLTDLLGRSLVSNRHSAKYPTKTGKLSLPYLNENAKDGAVELIRNEKKKGLKKKDVTNSNELPQEKKKKRKSRNRSSKQSSTVTDKSDQTENQSQAA